MRQSALLIGLCPPQSLVLPYLHDVFSNPSGHALSPGVFDIQTDQPGCVPAATFPNGSVIPPLLRSWAYTISIVEARANAIEVSAVDGSIREGHYTFGIDNTTALCQVAMTEQCLDRLGLEGCLGVTWQYYMTVATWFDRYMADVDAYVASRPLAGDVPRLPLRPPPAGGGGSAAGLVGPPADPLLGPAAAAVGAAAPDGGHSSPHINVPAAVGIGAGALLACAVVLAAALWLRRRRRGAAAAARAVSAKATATAPSVAAVDVDLECHDTGPCAGLPAGAEGSGSPRGSQHVNMAGGAFSMLGGACDECRAAAAAAAGPGRNQATAAVAAAGAERAVGAMEGQLAGSVDRVSPDSMLSTQNIGAIGRSEESINPWIGPSDARLSSSNASVLAAAKAELKGGSARDRESNRLGECSTAPAVMSADIVTERTPYRSGLPLDVLVQDVGPSTAPMASPAGGGGSGSIDGGRDLPRLTTMSQRDGPRSSTLTKEIPVVRLLPKLLGRGGFGRVYAGEMDGQAVAVKLIAEDLGLLNPRDAAEIVKGFEQELEVLARCSHPCIVRMLAACAKPPRPCIVMERMETSLERMLHGAPGTLLPLPVVIHIALEVARGLEYLHPTVLHRDLKPGNVLINDPHSPHPVVKISDFGLSRLRQTMLQTMHPEAGTPAYLAPECFDLSAPGITYKADIYAWGILVWEALAGIKLIKPWMGMTIVNIAVSVQVCNCRLPMPAVGMGAPGEGIDRWPPRLVRLIAECWDRDPLRRPAAAELVKRLLVIQEGHPGPDSGRPGYFNTASA
ncbi:hypothetical protein HYH03_010113 [Edaphochlamys debaryana]|uniref:Protein kinase domain-containing protein n=1 Tax=Edaphochlamys debaryana TaxID=47281 RepID=A0A835XXP2_9CHLO|nr:hypothetical protein HYH03_010113 [Edaphochlamys debaryana]|eukprot:KAG2491542.1 hypothetical protein HYH03_010113 [Edaphochlamys debaryana]